MPYKINPVTGNLDYYEIPNAGNANALVYKGVIDCSINPNYPAGNAGELYIVSVAGKIGGASGEIVEVGDMVICNTDGTVSGDQATVGVYWNIIQKNISGAVSGPASSANNNVAFFDGVTGKLIKDSGLALSGTNTGNQVISHTSDATSHLVTVSGSGGFLRLSEGSGITLTTTGTLNNGIVTIAAAQVNADWLATSGLAQILNKPSSLPTANVKHSVKYAEALTIGQAVYVSGANGTNILVSKADNSTEATSSKTLGLVTASGAANYQGEVITEGLLAGLNTSTATDGDAVWLGTNGNLIFWHYGLTTKPVAPAHLVFIGVVTRVSATVGEIFVKPQNGFEIDELHDVLITNPANDEVIAFDVTTGLWKNKTFTGSVPQSITNSSLIFYANNC